jgi:hypothetical protein
MWRGFALQSHTNAKQVSSLLATRCEIDEYILRPFGVEEDLRKAEN